MTACSHCGEPMLRGLVVALPPLVHLGCAVEVLHARRWGTEAQTTKEAIRRELAGQTWKVPT